MLEYVFNFDETNDSRESKFEISLFSPTRLVLDRVDIVFIFFIDFDKK